MKRRTLFRLGAGASAAVAGQALFQTTEKDDPLERLQEAAILVQIIEPWSSSEEAAQDFIIDFDRKVIDENPDAAFRRHHGCSLYSHIADVFGRLENLVEPMPMYATSKISFRLQNGWTLTPGAETRLVGLFT